jgi:anhydro-N-acetylmuramic acid kinase
LNADVGEAFANAALSVIDAANLNRDDVALIGSHGQTIWHEPPTKEKIGAGLQIGEAAVIAERTAITTISNMRARDIAAGGHGAPLVSFLDWLFFRHETKMRAIQNIGGIGNVTFLPPLSSTEQAIAFDTGPGNMLIDYCTRRTTNGALTFDRDGKLAASGHANQKLLDELMDNPYLHIPPPKTTGRELFGTQFGAELWQRGETFGMNRIDIIATATAFTAESIARAYRDFSATPIDEIYLAGGGAKNPTLVVMIRARVAPTQVYPHDQLGLAPDAKEAVAFAVMAYETIYGRPGNLPSCTGARHSVVMGDITPGQNFEKLFDLK